MSSLKFASPISLNTCNKEAIFHYFQNAWELEDVLMNTIVCSETFYLKPDSLRNPLIFYLGHSAAFYINKLIMVNLLEKRLNPDYELILGVGVDPQTSGQLKAETSHIQWPEVEKVWEYRNQVYQSISELIKNTPLNLPIHQNHPLWALIMGIEHQRIHFETSSMLIRQLPVEKVARPENWQYAPYNNNLCQNEMIEVSSGLVEVGKSEDSPLFGWDCEYGYRQVKVEPFAASKYMITNGEFQEFVNAGGYENQVYWDEESWGWKIEYNVKHPKFWIPNNGGYKYRAMFDEIELPLDWPVEVNHYEAMAYCRWKGETIRLMSEAEWHLVTYGSDANGKTSELDRINDFNLNLKFGSPSPVGILKQAESPSGLYDLRGNVWEWLNDDFNPLSGFKTHFLYEDNATPFFDNQHKMMLGGAWATNGTEALKFYRNWFRPNFYQHAGFRIAESQN
ncbi:5-histidylcysteine sulfoxide synthase [Floridanema evergladense]|uniref:5-histidylcysteine sulfoxide synthase n=1 Tax=Floridaenema evergladense BLCC-F167 TaxID=3153639 RepID=A0ABV4WTP8_9CYAN